MTAPRDPIERIAELRRIPADAAAAYVKVTFEIAMLGMKGFDVNDPARKYRLRSLPGEFSGLHLVCILDVGMKLVDPSADTGFDLSREYEEAKALFGATAEGLT